MKPQPMFASEVIDCIAQGRAPSADELARVADHIWTDMRGSRSAFAWGELTADSSERLLTLRAARAALAGNGQTIVDSPERAGALAKIDAASTARS